MNVSIARFSLALALAATFIACLAATAGAATKTDKSFGTKGTLALPRLASIPGQVASSCRVVNGRLFVAGRFGPNGLASKWNLGQRLAVTSVEVNKKRPSGAGSSWSVLGVGRGSLVVSQEFDDRGRLVYATEPWKSARSSELTIYRQKPSGTRDKSFAKNGRVKIEIPGLRPRGISYVRVIPRPDGSLFVVAAPKSSQVIVRIDKSGEVDKTWGTDGRLTFKEAIPTSFSVFADGSSVVGVGAPLTAPGTHAPAVLKLDVSGKVDTTWGTNGYWSTPGQPPTAGFNRPGQVRETLVLKNGNLAVLYADEKDTDLATGYTLRLAYLSPQSGQPQVFNLKIGEFDSGGDGGFPDVTPEVLQEGASGVFYGHAESFFSYHPGTFRGIATLSSITTAQTTATGAIDSIGFGTGAIAIDPDSSNLYLCGGAGKVISKQVGASGPQLRQVAVRRIKL